jgi:LytS/YehU family sensor histidine kinase
MPKIFLRLCQLLRYVTYEAGTDFMPLSKEINFIEDYIYLHRKRFEDTLSLDYTIDGVGDQKCLRWFLSILLKIFSSMVWLPIKSFLPE